ncbi:MAG: hypothetical protein ACI4AK_07950 [Lepagella sp.]
MDANELFNIQSIDATDISLPAESEGAVFLLESGMSSTNNESSFYESLLFGRNRDSAFYDYKLRVLDVSADVVDALGYNMICPVYNPLYDRTEFITAYASSDEIVNAASAIMDEADHILRDAYRDVLLLGAYSNPDEFCEAVGLVFDNPEPTSDYDNDGGESGFFHGLAGPLLGVIGGALRGAIGGVAGAMAGGGFGIVPNMPFKGTPIQSRRDDKHYLRDLSAQERKEMLLKIPDKMTASFEKQDPDTTRFVNEVADNLSADEMRAVLKLIYSRHKGVAQQTIYQITGGASKYELVIRPRGDKQTRFYRDKLWYVMYLKDPNGMEMPLIFKNAPAYCIYVMHVIDRYRNRENTRVLDLRQHREEFVEVYEALFQEDRAQIEHYYDELETRVNESTGKRRVGRYNDYIRDIHQTLERRLGTINSMPFKIGTNQFLSLLPSKIQLPPTLANIKIS